MSEAGNVVLAIAKALEQLKSICKALHERVEALETSLEAEKVRGNELANKVRVLESRTPAPFYAAMPAHIPQPTPDDFFTVKFAGVDWAAPGK